MKKKSLLLGVFMLTIFAATGSYHTFTSKSSIDGNLLTENVEALSDPDEATTGRCTKATKTAPCYQEVIIGYNPNTSKPIKINMQTHCRITEVTVYTPSLAEECLHDTVTEC